MDGSHDHEVSEDGVPATDAGPKLSTFNSQPSTRRRPGRPPHPDVLTPREWEVLALLRERLTNEQIASRLGVSLATAKYHVSEIISKLGVESREEAAAWRPEDAPGVAWWRRALAPLTLAKAAGIAATLSAVVGLGVLAWGVIREGESDANSNVAGGTPTAPPALPGYSSAYELTYVGPEGEVYTVPADGGAPRLLFQNDACRDTTISWSPGGERLLCNPFFQGRSSPASLLDASGQLLSTMEASDSGTFLGWSPDGRLFAHVIGDRLVIRDDSGRLVAELPAASPPRYPLVVSGRAAHWSPDGRRLVYSNADSSELHVYSVDTGVDLVAGTQLIPLAWMADGDRILVAHDYQPPNENGFVSFNVALLNLNDGSVSLLPELRAVPGGTVRSNLQLWLTPDTSKAAVLTSRPDGFPGLGVYDFGTRNLTVIPDSIISFGSDHIRWEQVQWAADSSRVYWLDGGSPTGSALYSAPGNGTELTHSADIGSTGGFGFFPPDGLSVAYNVHDPNTGAATLYVHDTDAGAEEVELDHRPAVGGVGASFWVAWRPRR
jgi:DNA-binding CsgD family transcriptional regulator